jgi:hypothetical protein
MRCDLRQRVHNGIAHATQKSTVLQTENYSLRFIGSTQNFACGQ